MYSKAECELRRWGEGGKLRKIEKCGPRAARVPGWKWPLGEVSGDPYAPDTRLLLLLLLVLSERASHCESAAAAARRVWITRTLEFFRRPGGKYLYSCRDICRGE